MSTQREESKKVKSLTFLLAKAIKRQFTALIGQFFKIYGTKTHLDQQLGAVGDHPCFRSVPR